MYAALETLHANIQGTFEEHVPLAAKYGFGAITVPDEILDDVSKAYAADALRKEYGLDWGFMNTPFDTFEAMSDAQFDEGFERLTKWCAVAEKIGVRLCYNHIWPGSDTLDYDANFELHVKRLGRVSRLMEAHGIRYGLECLGPKTLRDHFKIPFIHTIPGAMALSEAAGGKTGLVFDLYHWYCAGGRDDDLAYVLTHVDQVLGVHIADAVPERTREEQEDMERMLPMASGLIDARGILKKLADRGFHGPVYCEPQFPTIGHYAECPPEEAIATQGKAILAAIR